MLRPITPAAMLLVLTGSLRAATPDLAEACYQAALEPPTLEISDRILGYCTSAIDASVDPAVRANLLTDRAILQLKRKNRVAARTDLDAALRLAPASVPALVTLGHLHWLEGNLPAAEAVLDAAVETGDLAVALVNRSIVRRTRGDMAGSMHDALLLAGYDEASIARLAPPEIGTTPVLTPTDAPMVAPAIPPVVQPADSPEAGSPEAGSTAEDELLERD